MKRTGLIILVIGILITVFTGFNFITREKVVDLGELEITKNKNHDVTWSPLIGVVVMVIGGGIYLVGANKK
jgi:amino acid transporter